MRPPTDVEVERGLHALYEATVLGQGDREKPLALGSMTAKYPEALCEARLLLLQERHRLRTLGFRHRPDPQTDDDRPRASRVAPVLREGNVVGLYPQHLTRSHPEPALDHDAEPKTWHTSSTKMNTHPGTHVTDHGDGVAWLVSIVPALKGRLYPTQPPFHTRKAELHSREEQGELGLSQDPHTHGLGAPKPLVVHDSVIPLVGGERLHPLSGTPLHKRDHRLLILEDRRGRDPPLLMHIDYF